jgi:hypothetical protein
MPEILDFECPYISKEQIWEKAEDFRTNFWPEGTLPVNMEKIVESRMNLTIEPKHNLLSELDIDAYLKVDLKGVIVDQNCYMNEKFSNRLRFSLAHEIGHFFLHKDIFSSFSIEDPLAWKKFMMNISDRQYGFFEYQANEFAGRALVPREMLIKEMGSCIQELQKNGLINLVTKDPAAVLSSMSATLCKPFGVSDQVIERRVEREGIWPPTY